VLPPELAFTQQNFRPVVGVAPAGDTLVVAADDGEVQRLYLRSLRFPELEPLEGTENGTAPFFSPDGRWVGFSTTGDRMIKKVSLDGGQVISLTRGEWGGGSWGDDDTIVYTPDYTDGLWSIPAAGGEPVRLTSPDPAVGELNHSWPDHLPGTDALVFTSFRLPLVESRIELLQTGTGERRVLIENAVYARYVSAGYLVFVREGVMLAAPFDRTTLEVTGAPVPLFEDAFVAPFEGNSQFAVSEDGTLVWVPASVMQPPREVLRIDRSGRESVVLDAERRYSTPALSPDGRTLALTVDDGNPDIWLYELDRRVLNRLTFSPRSEFGGVWHPDGRSLIFIVDDPPFNIYQAPVDGSAPPAARVVSPVDSYAGGLSADGRWLAMHQNRPDSAGNIELLELVDGAEPTTVRGTPFNEIFATVSPDGRYVAYQSNETGRMEIYVQGVAGVGGRLQLSRAGGERPLWNRNGELYFWQGNSLTVVTVRSAPKLEASDPRVLFSVDHHVSSVHREFDVTADGREFFVTRTPEVAKPREIRVVLDWFTELERLAGSGGRQ
jgi:serine/threonine-protein kinase